MGRRSLYYSFDIGDRISDDQTEKFAYEISRTLRLSGNLSLCDMLPGTKPHAQTVESEKLLRSLILYMPQVSSATGPLPRSICSMAR